MELWQESGIALTRMSPCSWRKRHLHREAQRHTWTPQFGKNFCIHWSNLMFTFNEWEIPIDSLFFLRWHASTDDLSCDGDIAQAKQVSKWKGVKSLLTGGPLIDDLTECLGQKLPRLSSCIFIGFGEDSSRERIPCNRKPSAALLRYSSILNRI